MTRVRSRIGTAGNVGTACGEEMSEGLVNNMIVAWMHHMWWFTYIVVVWRVNLALRLAWTPAGARIYCL